LECRQCDESIYFDEEHISESGKKIPLDSETEEPHNCPYRTYQSKAYYCNACGKEIYFDDEYVSKNGKKIPLSKDTGSPHRCKNKPFNKETRRTWWRQQQYQAEQERERRRERQRQYDYHKRFWDDQKFRDEQRSLDSRYCQVLGISLNATNKEITEAYRQPYTKIYRLQSCKNKSSNIVPFGKISPL
jgi:hypothetical protein